jgi:hypothetical protein
VPIFYRNEIQVFEVLCKTERDKISYNTIWGRRKWGFYVQSIKLILQIDAVFII